MPLASEPPKPLRIGMLHFAHFHSYAYARHLAMIPGVSLTGVADRDSARGRDAALRLRTRYFPSVDALLREKPDAVIVGSENARHQTDVLDAASAGIHVFCEKPVATTVGAARRMIDACKRARVLLQVAFPVRFSPPVRRARELVRKGSIGTVLGASTTNRGRLVRSWFADPELSGGGAVMDHTVHVVDLLRWFLADEVVEVYAEAGRLLYADLGCEDCGLLSMKFRRGAFATLDTSWSRLESYPTWGDVTMRLWGKKGTIHLDAFSQNLTVWGDRARFEGWGSDCDFAMMEDFVATLRMGKDPSATAEDAMRALEVTVGAYESIRTKKPVRLPLREIQ
jgi:UDP-N-acetylglucosamine 3-dehydrogenase